ncbi:hypothetical protein GCM10008959_03640 [Deinococcus seoulensis]|uniref:Uncharacterized protein n=1 Tax=Deinococcus seoulensis TaxID=1837379 RepID=A0ABQ2RL35_9DEIO|nr:hypothetical protein [Deinococcus seoulensis]GGR45915.1 hypothetical protein GCM10008959_03640 [Deinococcus seoulensis]
MISSLEQILDIEKSAIDGEGHFNLSSCSVATEWKDTSLARVMQFLAVINESMKRNAGHFDLPEWFLIFTPEISVDEARRLLESTPKEQWDTLPWDRDSWLGAVDERSWFFVGIRDHAKQLQWHLMLSGFPANIESFIHILKAAGFRHISTSSSN